MTAGSYEVRLESGYAEKTASQSEHAHAAFTSRAVTDEVEGRAIQTGHAHFPNISESGAAMRSDRSLIQMEFSFRAAC